jgi:hypothetical protein
MLGQDTRKGTTHSTIGRGGGYACPECDPTSDMLRTQGGRQISQTSTASKCLCVAMPPASIPRVVRGA